MQVIGHRCSAWTLAYLRVRSRPSGESKQNKVNTDASFASYSWLN